MKTTYIIGGVAVAAALVGLYVWRSGGIKQAGANIGSGAVNVAGGAAAGAVGAIGAAVGLPTPWETTEDPETARWLIDTMGHFEASKRAGAPAYIRALLMAPGSGLAPGAPAGRTTQTPAQIQWQRPPTNNGAVYDFAGGPPLSFLAGGGSFKDLSGPGGFLDNSPAYGGGLDLNMGRGLW